MKTSIPSKIIDVWTRLDVFLGVKMFGNTDTLTEASNLTDELNGKSELQYEQGYRKNLDKLFIPRKPGYCNHRRVSVCLFVCLFVC